MPLEKKPFVRYDLEKTQDIVNIRINKKDREILNKFKELIGNDKDSTALKLALYYASNVLHQEFKGHIRVRLFKKRVQN